MSEQVMISRELLERINQYYMDGMSIYGELEELRLAITATTRPAGEVPDDFNCDSKPLQHLLNATAMMIETPCQDSATYWAACLAEVEHLLALQARAVVMPERIRCDNYTKVDIGSKNFKAGFNFALDEVARLNGKGGV